ncbi:hypothetical protein ACPV4B_14085 [Vibrio parahaemolyticus]
MNKVLGLILALGLGLSGVVKADTGIGLFVGDPYWGVDIKHNDLRFNVSLDDRMGFGVNKTYGIQNTPLYFFIGGHYVDRNHHYIAVTPGIGAEFRVKPVGFYVDVTPAVYLDQFDIELEARAGFRGYF